MDFTWLRDGMDGSFPTTKPEFRPFNRWREEQLQGTIPLKTHGNPRNLPWNLPWKSPWSRSPRSRLLRRCLAAATAAAVSGGAAGGSCRGGDAAAGERVPGSISGEAHEVETPPG